jgi:hypothetical protein
MTDDFEDAQEVRHVAYTRDFDGQTMVEVSPGWYVREYRLGTDGRTDAKPVVETMKDDGARFVDGKRVRHEPYKFVHPDMLSRRPQWFFVRATWVTALAKLDTWLPVGRSFLPKPNADAPIFDETDPASNRARIAEYNVKFPESKYPEHKIFPAAPRNSSLKRAKNPDALKALLWYMSLNESAEPLQSNYLQAADNDNFYVEREEGDPVQAAMGAEAEMEMRPSVQETLQRFDDKDIECIGFRNVPVGGVSTPERLSMADVDRKNPWAFYRIGGLQFAPCRTKHHWRGQLTHYRGTSGRWFPVKDELGTPKGPQQQCKGSDPKYWKPLAASTSNNSNVVKLSAVAKAKQEANRRKPLPCPMTPGEAWALWLASGKKPANDNRAAAYDGLPYKRAEPECAFGASYTPHEPEHDDVVDRRETLSAVNARFSPEERCAVSMIVWTDDTDKIAKNLKDIGRACATGRPKADKTYERHGKQILEAVTGKMYPLLQELAA